MTYRDTLNVFGILITVAILFTICMLGYILWEILPESPNGQMAQVETIEAGCFPQQPTQIIITGYTIVVDENTCKKPVYLNVSLTMDSQQRVGFLIENHWNETAGCDYVEVLQTGERQPIDYIYEMRLYGDRAEYCKIKIPLPLKFTYDNRTVTQIVPIGNDIIFEDGGYKRVDYSNCQNPKIYNLKFYRR